MSFVHCTSQWEPSRVIGNYLELINMSVCFVMEGQYTAIQKLACFVKIINTFLFWYASYGKLTK